MKLDNETSKIRTSLKQAAKRGDVKSARILAGAIVRSGKQKDRLTVSKARLNSIGMHMCSGVAHVTGHFPCVLVFVLPIVTQ